MKLIYSRFVELFKLFAMGTEIRNPQNRILLIQFEELMHLKAQCSKIKPGDAKCIMGYCFDLKSAHYM